MLRSRLLLAVMVATLFVGRAFAGLGSDKTKYLGGTIKFLKALKMGLLIAVIGSTVYVATWEISYFNFYTDFFPNYMNYEINAMKKEGKSEKEISDMRTKMEEARVDYDKPLYNIMVTYTEILPVGILVSLIAALTLQRRKLKTEPVAA